MSKLESPTIAEQAEQVTPDAIMQLGLGFWGSKTLLSAVELGLFAVISKSGPLDAEELRERLGLHPRMTVGTQTLRRPNTSLTRQRRATSVGCWRWPMHAHMRSGGR